MADEIDSQTKSVSPSNNTMSISEITSYKERRKKRFWEVHQLLCLIRLDEDFNPLVFSCPVVLPKCIAGKAFLKE